MNNKKEIVLAEKLRRKQTAMQGGLIHPILGYYYPPARSRQFVQQYTKLNFATSEEFRNLQV